MKKVFSSDALHGQTVLITGASGGIGATLAQQMADAGASLILLDLEKERLETVAKTLPFGACLATVPGDMSLGDVQSRLVAEVQSAGGVDHLIMAAGIYQEKFVEAMSNEFFDRTLATNLGSVFQLTRDLIPLLRNNGSILYFSSVAGMRGSKAHAAYSATKAALVAFGRSLAWELGDRRIRVNAVAPGIIETSMTKDLLVSKGDELLKATPLQRFGQATEVASVALFLCTPAANFVNGEVIQINGGLYMA